MDRKNQILTTAITGLLLILSNPIHAVYDYSYNQGEMFPCSWCVNKTFIRGDLLYLTAFEEGLTNIWEPTHTFEASEISESFELAIGKGKSPHFKWDLGYRVGAGIDFQECKWNIAAFWTHFSPGHSKHSHDRPNWKLDYDTLDLVIGYKCQFNNCFTLDAFGGVRAARINQHLRGQFTNRTIRESESSSDSFTFITRNNKQHFEGVGFLFGLAGEFDIGCGFKAYLEGDAGTICGHNKIKSLLAVDPSDCEFIVYAHKHRQKACPYYVESSVGIQWETCLCGDLNLVLDLGYESHNYLNFGRILDCGNLYIHGGRFALALQY